MPAKLCVTVTADTTAELRTRRDRVTDADIVELRLDTVKDPNAAADGRSPSQAFDSMTARGGGTPRPGQTRKVARTPRKARPPSEEASQAPQETGADNSADASAPAAKPAAPAPVVAFGATADGESEKRAEAAGSEAESSRPSGGAEIVSLDKFRKK